MPRLDRRRYFGRNCNPSEPDLFERVSAVASEAPSPSFLHSALCAMSLPVRRPTDEHAPIIRQDGQYTQFFNFVGPMAVHWSRWTVQITGSRRSASFPANGSYTVRQG